MRIRTGIILTILLLVSSSVDARRRTTHLNLPLGNDSAINDSLFKLDNFVWELQAAAGAGSFNKAIYYAAWHGAVCDESTDDTNAIQAAINECEANGGGIIVIPQGTCVISSMLTMKMPDSSTNCHLMGYGIRVTRLKQATDKTVSCIRVGGPDAQCSSTQDTTCTLDSDCPSGETCINLITQYNHISGMVLEDCNYAIQVTNAIGTHIENISVEDANVGIWVEGQSEHTQIHRVDISTTTSHGIALGQLVSGVTCAASLNGVSGSLNIAEAQKAKMSKIRIFDSCTANNAADDCAGLRIEAGTAADCTNAQSTNNVLIDHTVLEFNERHGIYLGPGVSNISLNHLTTEPWDKQGKCVGGASPADTSCTTGATECTGGDTCEGGYDGIYITANGTIDISNAVISNASGDAIPYKNGIEMVSGHLSLRDTVLTGSPYLSDLYLTASTSTLDNVTVSNTSPSVEWVTTQTTGSGLSIDITAANKAAITTTIHNLLDSSGNTLISEYIGLQEAETIAAAGTITANSCGGFKAIASSSSITTNTINTFTVPARANYGDGTQQNCIMHVCNINNPATNYTITLDDQGSVGNFRARDGRDVILSPNDCVTVATNGSVWYQVGDSRIDNETGVHNVLAYGAKCDCTDAACAGGTDDTAAILAAKAAAEPTCGTIFFPPGRCKVSCAASALTACLEWTDSCVSILGSSPPSDFDNTEYTTFGTVITSASNAPILKFTGAAAGGVTGGRWNYVENIGIEGRETAGSNQDCIVVSTRGMNFSNVWAGFCGSDGWLWEDSVGATCKGCRAHDCAGDGIAIDNTNTKDDSGSACSGGTCALSGKTCAAEIDCTQGAITTLTWIGGFSSNNAGDGIDFRNGGNGLLFLNTFFENNSGYGIRFSGPSGSRIHNNNRFINIWDELNVLGMIKWNGSGSQQAQKNYIHYSHASSMRPSPAMNANNNNRVEGPMPELSNASCLGLDDPWDCCTGAAAGTCTIAANSVDPDLICEKSGYPLECCTGDGTGTCAIRDVTTLQYVAASDWQRAVYVLDDPFIQSGFGSWHAEKFFGHFGLPAGTQPATTGVFNGGNNRTLLSGRNAADNADIPVALVTTGDLVSIDGGGNGATFGGVILSPDGTIGAPTYSFTSDSDSGVTLRSGTALSLVFGGLSRLATTASLMVINDDSQDYDLRIEGDTDLNLLRTDAGNDRVGIGTNAPATKLDVNGTLTSTSSAMTGQSAPPFTCSTSGGFYVDSDLNLPCFCNGTNWVQMDDFSTVCS